MHALRYPAGYPMLTGCSADRIEWAYTENWKNGGGATAENRRLPPKFFLCHFSPS